MRRKSLLEQIEKDVLHDLSGAYAELQRGYATSKTGYNRLIAARDNLNVLRTKFEMLGSLAVTEPSNSIWGPPAP